MKAAYGQVRQVKKLLSTNEAIIEVQITQEAYKDAVQLLDGQLVLVTIAPGDIKGEFRVLDGKEKPPPSKRSFAELPPSQQAAIRGKNEPFRNWLKIGITEDGCAVMVREYCGVKSRAELDTPGDAQDKWVRLNNQFWKETRYGEDM